MFSFFTSRLPSTVLSLSGMVLMVALAGCGGGGGGSSPTPPPPPPPPPSVTIISGAVMSGNIPVVGATVSAWAANPTAGAPATKLGEGTSDSNGEFVVTGTSLPGDGSLVYVMSNEGDTGGGVNSAILLASVAGTYCSGSGCAFPESITVNELTSTATAYSFAGFLDVANDAVNISGAISGLKAATTTFSSLIDPINGKEVFQDAAGCDSNPEPDNCAALRTLNTLASLAAACVESPGTNAGPCGDFLSASGSATNVFAALDNIASLPAVRNAGSAIFAPTPGTTYKPALTRAPNDWALALVYAGGGLHQPTGVAVDAVGNVWVANYKPGNNNGTHDGSISKFAQNGSALSPATGFTGGGLLGSWGIAIDADGDAWVGNWNGGDGTVVSEIASDGTPVAQDGYTLGGISPGPMAITVAPDGTVWVGNFGNSSLSKLDASGTELAHYTGGGLALPIAVAVDNDGNVWLANSANSRVSEFSATGQALSPAAGYTGGGLDTPDGLALDANGNVWIANFFGPNYPPDSTVTKLVGGNTPPPTCPAQPGPGDTGCALSPATGFHGGGLNAGNFIAVDSAGHVFVSNYHGNSLSELAVADGAPLSPNRGYRNPSIVLPSGIAIDSAGNLWMASFGSNQLIKFIGIAAPVKTPLSGLPKVP